MNVRDQLTNHGSAFTARTAFLVIDALQSNARPGEQVAVLGTLFLLLCEMFRVAPREALEITSRSMRDSDNKHLPHIAALRDYIEKELIRAP